MSFFTWVKSLLSQSTAPEHTGLGELRSPGDQPPDPPTRNQPEHPGLKDPRLSKAISALMANVSLSPEGKKVEGAGSEGPVLRATNLFKELHEAYPDSPELHFAWAASPQVAMQGETATKVLRECVQAHSNFWLSRATLKQNALQTWNPFFFPDFSQKPGEQVHPVINRTVSSNILLATRQGVLPRAVIFLRDAGGELAISKLNTCVIEFITTISKITNPQLVAINGRIHDDPVNPYQCEFIDCPIRPFGSEKRFRYELFVRQDNYDFVVLDNAGRVKYIRQMRPSIRMRAAHARLAGMLERMEGPEPYTSDVLRAIDRHQAIFDPKKISY